MVKVYKSYEAFLESNGKGINTIILVEDLAEFIELGDKNLNAVTREWLDEQGLTLDDLHLYKCKRCFNCNNCNDCNDCDDCNNCVNCNNCRNCINCINCRNCIDCEGEGNKKEYTK